MPPSPLDGVGSAQFCSPRYLSCCVLTLASHTCLAFVAHVSYVTCVLYATAFVALNGNDVYSSDSVDVRMYHVCIRRGRTPNQRTSKPGSACDGRLSLPRDRHYTPRDHTPSRDHSAEYIRPAVDQWSDSDVGTVRLCACRLHSHDSFSTDVSHQHAAPSPQLQLYAHASSPRPLPFPPADRLEAAILSRGSSASRDLHAQPDVVTSS